MTMHRVLIMAGGTGGHVFPALAVAKSLAKQGVTVTWLGTRRGLEVELVPQAGFPIEFISISGLRGNGIGGWLIAPVRLSRALWQALRTMRRVRPTLVLGMGGFVSGPGGLAAKLLGQPLVIHEQNAVPGFTNRLLARVADRMLTAFPLGLEGAEQTGNPIREEIAQMPPPPERLAGRTGPLRLLVIGGSLGALALNETVPQALAALADGQRFEVWHQSGQRHLQATQRAYGEAGVAAKIEPFLSDMAAAYGWADLVLCRAGALTVSELAAAGVAAVLVPYPHAVDDHQTRNAHFLADARAAILLPQDHLDRENLAELLRSFSNEPDEGRERLLGMALAARALARPDATREVTDICLAESRGVHQ